MIVKFENIFPIVLLFITNVMGHDFFPYVSHLGFLTVVLIGSKRVNI